MFQLAFGLGTDTWEPGIVGNAFRWLCSMLDTVVYQLIVLVYQVLFTIADSSILSSEFIKDFYERFQLIIGVFMIFKLSISVLQAVINPDVLTDQKNGMNKIITRIITMLLMFTAIIPLNIPNATSGSYNAYLNQHGLLFGTMYSLQARILDQGTIEKLILGKVDSGGDEDTDEIDSESGINKKESANRMASYMLKAFVSINMKENASGAGDDDEKNYMCPVDEIDIDKEEEKGEVYEVYNQDDVSPMDILKYVNTTCNYKDLGDKISGQEGRYALAYFPIVPTICGILVLYVLLTFCIDVAIRSLKLAILRLIAPIPIMSYISPKSSENGSFANWTKLLISTFLNLFIILAIVFFTISVVSKMADKDQTVLSLPISDEFSVVNTIATVFIMVGVFLFAKQAPKFIMDALGIKGMGLGAGLSGALGAAGALMGGGGLAGAMSGFVGAANDASTAASQGKQAPSALDTQRANMAKMITGDDKNDGSMGYRMQKALHDKAGTRAMNKLYGINQNSLLTKKQQMYDSADEAARAKDLYDRFAKDPNSLTMTEKMDAQAAGYGIYDAKTDTLTMSAADRAGYQAVLQENMEDKQADAGKIKSDFEKMQKIGDRANILMTPEQEHRTSMRERVTDSMAYRAVKSGVNSRNAGGSATDVFKAVGNSVVKSTQENRTAHQSIGQRVGTERDRNGNLKNNKF